MKLLAFALGAYGLVSCSSRSPQEAQAALLEVPPVDAPLRDAQLLRPRHSPDGTRIAYFVRPGASASDEFPFEGYELRVAVAAGGEAKRLGASLYHSAFLAEPCWSPDGAFVVVAHWEMGGGGLEFESFHVASGEGGAFAQPEHGASVHTPAAWSGDGNWVALCWNSRGAAVARVIHPDGSVRGEARLEGKAPGWAAASFDSTGERLAFVGCGQFALLDTAGEDGTPLRSIFTVPLDASTSEASRPPVFLRDGRRVACCFAERAFLIELDTHRVAQLALPGDVIDLCPAPDGERLVALVEEQLPNSALEVLAGAGHARDLYRRRLLEVELRTLATRELTNEASSTARPSFLAELALSPQALQVLSRWR